MIAFRSPWGFAAEYWNPASGNEKGGVENEVGRYRRNWLVAIPEANDLAALNEQLLAGCVSPWRPECEPLSWHRTSGGDDT